VHAGARRSDRVQSPPDPALADQRTGRAERDHDDGGEPPAPAILPDPAHAEDERVVAPAIISCSRCLALWRAGFIGRPYRTGVRVGSCRSPGRLLNGMSPGRRVYASLTTRCGELHRGSSHTYGRPRAPAWRCTSSRVGFSRSIVAMAVAIRRITCVVPFSVEVASERRRFDAADPLLAGAAMRRAGVYGQLPESFEQPAAERRVIHGVLSFGREGSPPRPRGDVGAAVEGGESLGCNLHPSCTLR